MGVSIMSNSFNAIKSAMEQIHLKAYEKTLKWTPDTLYCKNRGCVCEGCYLKQYPCRLKARVLELVRVIGKPENFKEPTVTENREQEIKHLLERYNKGQVCEILGISRKNLNKLLEKINESEA